MTIKKEEAETDRCFWRISADLYSFDWVLGKVLIVGKYLKQGGY